MEPLQGTNISLALMNISTENLKTQNELGFARAKLVLDTIKDSGSQIVEMLEGLGENIDTYA